MPENFRILDCFFFALPSFSADNMEASLREISLKDGRLSGLGLTDMLEGFRGTSDTAREKERTSSTLS